MNAFGWIYLILTIFGIMVKISQIEKPRPPVTHGEAIITVLISAFLFYGLYVWGLH